LFHVPFDIRKHSPTFPKSPSEILSAQNKPHLSLPQPFPHPFYLFTHQPQFLYKSTHYYNPKPQHSLISNHPTLRIQSPLQTQPN
ncbi:dTDP-4-dehydrorhamnose 3,5-epimerase family protein, partial [Neisseria sicca]|uniref:dTDP-4-dehydrorhamnose 3,5-epimerase family protein n=1 Tax=Neisseria sicca TaxID=490 RepID=UPI001649A856